MAENLPARPAAIEIRIGNVDLVTKLDALAAAIAAIREAHRYEMSPAAWAALNDAQAALVRAILTKNERRPVELPIAM
jgi:hypothetical protein